VHIGAELAVPTQIRKKLRMQLEKICAALEELKSRIFTLGSRDRAFYVVGAVMAQQIERGLGRPALVETIRQGPRAFFEAYHQSRPIFPIPTLVAAH